MRITITLSFLLSALLCYSQISEADLLQKERNEEQHQNNILLQESKTEKNLETISEVRSMEDADGDGMDDDWELENGLDPTDNRDAWTDLDGDAIKNMFEFQLGSDPDSASDPQTTNYDPFEDNFNSLVRTGIGGLVVLRMSEGVYDTENTISFATMDTRIMIQGGWNSDFTEHNPDKYKTRIVGPGNDEILYFSSTTDADNDVEVYTLILEGFEIEQGGSTFGNINFITWRVENSVLCVYDVKSSNSSTDGMTYNHWFGSTATVIIANSEFTNNGLYGITNQSTDGSNAVWTYYNVTVSGNGANNETGLHSLENGQSNVEFNATNLIAIFNLDELDLELPDRYTGEFRNSNFTKSDIANTEITEVNSIEIDPRFMDPVGGDYTLASSSPCINTGLDVGLAFNESAPEMGAYEFGDIMSSNEDVKNSKFSFRIVSNLIEYGNDIQLEHRIQKNYRTLQVQITDARGTKISTSSIDSRAQNTSLRNNLSPGSYFIQLLGDGAFLVSKQFVVY